MREIITLECTVCKNRNYTTTKNKRTATEKLERKKFDPRAFNAETGKNGAHVIFKEEKVK